MNISIPFDFGDQVKHELTGLVGCVTAVDAWKNGCVRVCIQPREIKDGKPVDGSWVDEQDLVLVAPGEAPEAAPSGGPYAAGPPPPRGGSLPWNRPRAPSPWRRRSARPG